MEDVLLIFSGNSSETLEESSQTVLDYILEEQINREDSAWTLQIGRRELPIRKYLVWSKDEDLKIEGKTYQVNEQSNYGIYVVDQWEELPEIDQSIYSTNHPFVNSFNKEKRNAVSYFPTEIRREVMEAVSKGSTNEDIAKAASFVYQYAFIKAFSKFRKPSGCIGQGAGVLAYEVAVEGMDIGLAIQSLKNNLVSREDELFSILSMSKKDFGSREDIISMAPLSLKKVLDAIGKLWTLGMTIDWKVLYSTQPRRVSLPKYSFKKTVLPSEINRKKATKKPEKPLEIYSFSDIKEELSGIWFDLLGEEDIKDRDDFFNLGGDSLNAAQMASMILSRLKVKVPIDVIYEDSRFIDLARWLHEHFEASNPVCKIKKVKERETYETSYAQQRMFTVQGLEPDSLAYNLGAAYLVEGNLDLEELEQALNQLVKAHPALRTSFHLEKGTVVQKVEDTIEFSIDEKWVEPGVEPDMTKLAEPFDLSVAPLFKVKVLKSQVDKLYLYIDMHHIIGDQSSIAILMRDLELLLKNRELETSEIQYVDFAHWQNKQIEAGEYKPGINYWKNELKDLPMPTEIIGDYPRPEIWDSRGKYFEYLIPGPVSKEIKDLGTKYGLTNYMVLVGAYALLLSRYTDCDDIIIGTAVAGRELEEVQDIVGMFVNTLPLRFSVNLKDSIETYFSHIKDQIISTFQYQEVPFELLLDALSIEHNPSHGPLFDICINYVNMGTEELSLEGVNLTPIIPEKIDAKYDLMLTVVERGDKLSLDIEYRSSLYKKSTIEKFVHRYMELLQGLFKADAKTELFKVNFIEETEIEQLKAFNETKTKAPIHRSVISLFEEVVERQGEKPALTWKETSLTYRELNGYANYFANELSKLGIVKGDVVSLLLDQGIEQIVAILAILKLGAIYLPIDPNYPKERIEFMNKDASAKLCLLNSTYFQMELPCEKMIIEIKKPLELDSTNIESPYTPKNLSGQDEMNIIFTSGSTGRPKGVLLRQEGMIRTVLDTNFIHVSPGDRFAQMVNYTFDPSGMEIFSGLLNGAHLFMIPKDLLMDFPNYEIYLKEQEITQAIFITPVFHLFVDYNPKALSPLKKVFIGGDALNPKHAKHAAEIIGPGNVVNLYGPTEASITASFYEVNRVDSDWSSVPIGRPISGVELYVVDRYLNPLPTGIPGELLIGGVGLAKEYLNSPDLTEVSFIELPSSGKRVYRTGDRVVLDEDFQIHFLGRMDSQVKIGGYRIELDEIKNKMVEIPEIAEAIVRTNRDSNESLYIEAYYTLKNSVEKAIGIDEIEEKLREDLPNYMIPTRMMELNKIPLTRNGKLDKKNLPPIKSIREKVIEKSRASEETTDRANPKSALDIILEKMSNILDVENLDPSDDFFNMGGQSIKAIALSHELRKSGLDISVNKIFAKRTAKAIAESLSTESPRETTEKSSKVQGDLSITEKQADLLAMNYFNQAQTFSNFVASAEDSVKFELSPVQQLHLNLGNEGTGFSIRVIAENDLALKRRVINLIKHQDMLCSVISIDNQWQLKLVEEIEETLVSTLQIIDLTEYTDESQRLIIERSFEILTTSPYERDSMPWRILIIKIGTNNYMVLWSFDHLIFDGMSAEIIKQGLGQEIQGNTNYRNYIELLSNGPAVKSEDELRAQFNLDQWFTKNSQMMSSIKGEKNPAILTVSEPLTEGTENAWNQAYSIVQKLMEEKVGEIQLPLLIVDYGRSYLGENFFDCVGEFIDLIPFYSGNGNSPEEDLTEKLQYIQDKGINFTWLMQNNCQEKTYKYLSRDLMSLMSDNTFDAMILNFQGYISPEQQRLFKRTEGKGIVPISKLHANVYYDDYSVYVSFYSQYGFSQEQVDLYRDSDLKEIYRLETN